MSSSVGERIGSGKRAGAPQGIPFERSKNNGPFDHRGGFRATREMSFELAMPQPT